MSKRMEMWDEICRACGGSGWVAQTAKGVAVKLSYSGRLARGLLSVSRHGKIWSEGRMRSWMAGHIGGRTLTALQRRGLVRRLKGSGMRVELTDRGQTVAQELRTMGWKC